MTKSRNGAGNIEDEPEALCNSDSNKLHTKPTNQSHIDGGMSRKQRMKQLPMVKAKTI